MRYLTAALIPIGFVVAGFSLLTILAGMADNWSPEAQQRLASAATLWAQNWWWVTIVLAAACFIAATVSDALRPATKSKR